MTTTEAAAAVNIDVVLPTLGAAVSFPASRSEIDAGAGLHITTQQGDFTILFQDDPETIQTVLVPPAAHLPTSGLPSRAAGDVVLRSFRRPRDNASRDPC